MSRFVDVVLNTGSTDNIERLGSLDLALQRRWGYRRADQELRLSSRRHVPSPMAADGLETNAAVEFDAMAVGRVVGGLEVVADITNAGFNVTLTAGAMLAPHTAGTLTRPASYTPAPASPDDDPVAGLYVLDVDAANLHPSSVPGSVSAVEWWAVCVTPDLAAKETDSARKQLNRATGVVSTVATAKVFHRVLTPSVVRGTGGGDISTVTIPAGAVVVAWLYVHKIGDTSLANALVYDARRMADPSADNAIGGTWVVNNQAVTGEWRATLQGERLSLRPGIVPSTGTVADTTLTVADIAEPGATWSGGGGIAYFYLCRVRGTVPRLRGTLRETGNITAFTSFEVEGMLVLSPKPPATFSGGGGGTAFSERFDLRNDQTLTLPNPTHSAVAFPKKLAVKFGGTVPAGEAICVGFYPYAGASSGLPVTDNGSTNGREVQCSPDGWVGGAALSLGFLPIVGNPTLTTNPAVQGGTPTAVFTIANSTASKKVPVDGLKFSLLVTSGNADTNNAQLQQIFNDETNRERPSTAIAQMRTVGAGPTVNLLYPTTLRFLPSVKVVRAKWVMNTGVGTLAAYTLAAGSYAYRLPFGEPLFTPR